MINHNNTARIIVNLARLVLGLALVALALVNVDWSKLTGVFSSVEIPWLVVGIFSVLTSLGLKVARWGWLVKISGQKLDWPVVLRAFFTGQAANIVFPFRGGEAIRVGIAWAGQKSAKPAILISVLLEKYLDLLFLFIAALFTILWLPPTQVEWVKTILALAVILASLFLILLILGGSWLWRKILSRLPESSQKRRPIIWLTSAVQGLRHIRSWRAGLTALSITSLIWVNMTLTNLFFFQSIHLETSLPAALLVVVAVYIGMIPALMPGNFGPFYLAVQLALQPFTIPSETAAGFAILLHAVVTTAPLLIAGVVYLLPFRSAQGSEVV